MILPYRSAIMPKASAKICFLEKFTHTLPKIAKQNQKRGKKLLIAQKGMAEKIKKKGSERNFSKILNFFPKLEKVTVACKFFSKHDAIAESCVIQTSNNH